MKDRSVRLSLSGFEGKRSGWTKCRVPRHGFLICDAADEEVLTCAF